MQIQSTETCYEQRSIDFRPDFEVAPPLAALCGRDWDSRALPSGVSCHALGGFVLFF